MNFMMSQRGTCALRESKEGAGGREHGGGGILSRESGHQEGHPQQCLGNAWGRRE